MAKTEKEINTDIITNILTREGGSAFTNFANDKPTKYGITLDTLKVYRKRHVSFNELKALTEDEARDIYLELYIERPNFSKIKNVQLRELVVDCGVNSGQRIAAIWLQRALDVSQDGIVGKETLGALENANVNEIFKKICSYRIKFYVQLSLMRNSFTFLEGWINRATSFLEWTIEESKKYPDVV